MKSGLGVCQGYMGNQKFSDWLQLVPQDPTARSKPVCLCCDHPPGHYPVPLNKDNVAFTEVSWEPGPG